MRSRQSSNTEFMRADADQCMVRQRDRFKNTAGTLIRGDAICFI